MENQNYTKKELRDLYSKMTQENRGDDIYEHFNEVIANQPEIGGYTHCSGCDTQTPHIDNECQRCGRENESLNTQIKESISKIRTEKDVLMDLLVKAGLFSEDNMEETPCEAMETLISAAEELKQLEETL